jgi:hypothetical protein
MPKEVNAHTDKEHWEAWAKADVPANQDILPSVWSFKTNRHQRDPQAQGPDQCSWWQADAWRESLGDLFTRGQLVFKQPLPDHVTHVQMGDSAD